MVNIIFRILFSAITLGGWIWSITDMLVNRHLYETSPDAAGTIVLYLRFILIGSGLYISVSLLNRVRKHGFFRHVSPIFDWYALRFAFYCILPPLILTSLLNMQGLALLKGDPFLIKSMFYSILWLSCLLWASRFVVRLPRPAPTGHRSRSCRLVDIICMNTLLVLILGETFLFAANRIRPSMLLYSASNDVMTRLKTLKQKPGEMYFDLKINSGGYFDEEFFVASSSDLVIGLLADSFGLGVVPYEFNFTRIAERTLQERFQSSYDRIAIHNFGIPGAGMKEYAGLLETEVLSTRPAMVVLCLFVGNDVMESEGFGEAAFARYTLQNWYLWLLPRRMLILEQEQRRKKTEQYLLQGDQRRRVMQAPKIPDYVYDTSKEPPNFSTEKFHQIEKNRFEVCNPSNLVMERGYQGVFAGLRHFKRLLGKNWMVIVIPDEFQVNDDVFDNILETHPRFASYQRDYPQQRITAFCKEQHIQCIDMLPYLREAQKTDRTYHLRDTHLNAYGNRVVGDVLGRELIRMVSNSETGK